MGCNEAMERTCRAPDVDGGPLIRPRPADPDAVLVEQLRRRDPAAPEALVVAYGARVYRLAIRITHWRAARKAARSNAAVVDEPQTEEGPEAPPGGGRVGGSGPI